MEGGIFRGIGVCGSCHPFPDRQKAGARTDEMIVPHAIVGLLIKRIQRFPRKGEGGILLYSFFGKLDLA